MFSNNKSNVNYMLFLNIKEKAKKKIEKNKSNYNNSNKTELKYIIQYQRVMPV